MEKTKNTILRMLALLLATLMVFASFASCADKGKTEANNADTTLTGTESGESEENRDYLLELPQMDFNGEKYSILVRTNMEYEMYTESEVGENVEDAVFRRNSRVNERYNVEIVSVPVEGEWVTQGVFSTAVTKSVTAGDCAYDLIAGYMAYTTGLATSGNFMNLLEVPGINFENPWWTAGYIENNKIDNCLYMALGDISMTMWEYITCMYFNKQIVEDYNIENIYSLVNSGAWTYDKLMNLAKTIYSDVNSNGKLDNADKFGLTIDNNGSRVFVPASGIDFTETDSEGTLTMVMFGEKYVDLYTKTYDLLRKKEQSIFYTETDEAAKVKIFQENRALFMTGHLQDSEVMRGMETDFGIIPYPKYNETQDNYITIAADVASVFCLPKVVKNVEMSGMILEALCAESAHSVIPEYYETALKGKYSRDNDSAEMIDILRDTLKFDFGYVHAVVIGSIYEMFGNQIYYSNPNITSFYEKNKKLIDKGLEKVLKAYAAIE